MRTSWLKSNGDALNGLKVSSVTGGKEALQEVFHHAMNEARGFYWEEEKLHIIRGRTTVAGIGGSFGSIASLDSTSREVSTACRTRVVGSNRDVDKDGRRMRTRVCNLCKVSSARGVGRIMGSPGIIIISSSRVNDRKIALEITSKGWFTSGNDILRGGWVWRNAPA